eukprot:TRINITY_DN24154_c0_g1_i1.p1 TRINITY_DN24154_c0_g1~~TRINITY_DN24154_c0_g1_i1.p1  ORF type:complete len:674 (+),score=81.10 TRINITY_DN24154_c0_g1_i1:84-2105(+)
MLSFGNSSPCQSVSQRSLLKRMRRAFYDSGEELAFVDYLAPQVAKRTLVGHGAMFCINMIAVIWNAAQLENSWHEVDSVHHGSGSRDALFFATCFVIHAVVVAGIGVVYCVRSRSVRWELISVLSTALLAVMLPWLDPLRGFVFLGGTSDDVLGSNAKWCEAQRLLAILSVIHVYAICVPIRWRFCFVVPLCCSMSTLVLFWTSPHEQSTIFELLLFVFLLFVPAFGQRLNIKNLRERWRLIQQMSDGVQELHDKQAMPEILCADVTFKLTSTFCFVDSDSSRDAFFGRAVEGTSIMTFIPPEDRDCFSRAMESISVTNVIVLDCVPIILEQQAGIANVKVFMQACQDVRPGEAPTFLVSLKTLGESSIPEICPRDRAETLETAFETIPSSTLTSECDPVVLGRQWSPDSDVSLSDVSFTYSVDSGGDGSLVLPLNGTSQNNPQPRLPPLVPASTQTSEDEMFESAEMLKRVITEEVAVNTSWSWHKDEFRCLACAKPPKLPGPLPKLPKKANRHKKRQQQEKQYEGTEFDGAWVLRDDESQDVPDWLSHLCIEGAHVVLGDLSATTLVVDESTDACLLRSGAIWLEDDGTLVRKGNSGRILHYKADFSDEDDDTSETSSLASVALSSEPPLSNGGSMAHQPTHSSVRDSASTEGGSFCQESQLRISSGGSTV